MAINNLNPRRTVWFSPREPLNKYDIWLSKNVHCNENGESTIDSNAQRDCDYIFKIYDCGKWNPIVGFNTTALNKINTVKDIEYTFTHNGTNYTKTGFSQFSLPLFRDPEDSPAELFSFGTIGESINEFVTATEWGNIFDNSNFYNAWNTAIGNGHIHLPWADINVCGGINSDRHADPTLEAAFKAVECKYFPSIPRYSSQQYRLCVSASDIIDALNEYSYEQQESGNPPFIRPGVGTVPIFFMEPSVNSPNENDYYMKINWFIGNQSIQIDNATTKIVISDSLLPKYKLEQYDSNTEKCADDTDLNYPVFIDLSSTAYYYEFDVSQKNNIPVYLLINASSLSFQNGCKVINDITIKGIYLITIQFGIIKVELITTI